MIFFLSNSDLKIVTYYEICIHLAFVQISVLEQYIWGQRGMEVNFNSRYDENLERSTSDAVFSVMIISTSPQSSIISLVIYLQEPPDRLAQSVEHQTFHLRIMGSSPTLDDLKFVFFAQDIIQHKSRQRMHKVISTQ